MNIFEITIQRQYESGWLVVVTQTAAGNFLPVRNEGTLNLSTDDFTQLRRLHAQPQAYGTFLGKALFQDQIRDAFVKAFSNSKEGLRVLLNVEDDQLKSQIFWQRLCAPIDGNWYFLALNQRVPLFYLPSNTDRYFPPIGKRDLNALILVASPKGLDDYKLHSFDVEETVSRVRIALGKIPADVLADLPNRVGFPTLDTFCKQLTRKRYTLLHIVCHGRLNRDGETLLYWTNNHHKVEPISATNLLKRLKQQRIKGLPYFAFLSACEGAVPEAEAALGGLAQRMVKDLGMPAVIAMTQSISIKTATFLSTEFYQRLRDRGEVDVALVEATAACAERFDILVPALFSRLRGQPLFSEILDRDLNNAEIEYGLLRLPELLEVRSPISIEKFTQLNYILQKTLKNDPEALSTALKEQRVNALKELNSLCNFIIDISFNALAFDQEPPAYDHRCPFQGLYPFKPENRAFFFGREPLVQELKQKLVGEHFLAVVGKSGSGKSSLVLAGLVPTLQEEQPELQLVYLTPDQDPLKQLLSRLSSVHKPSIIVVDQFEELFTLCTDKLKRLQFIERLIQLIQIHRIVITLRDDFLGECAVHSELGKYVETRQKLIAPMQPEELRRAMEQQAAQVGLQFEAGLSAAIFGDVKDEPGAMPLLQHALWELWRRRHGRWLIYREYEEIGTVKQAIARTADEFYHKLSAQEQQQVKDIFLRLTRLDDSHINYQERLDTRRRVEMEKLVPVGEDIAVIKDLVRRLANEDARLVVTSRNSVTGKEEVEVAHEALIRHWSKLQDWLNTNRNDLQIRERIRVEAEDWKLELKEDCLLLQGGRLEDAERLLCQNPQFFNQQEADYIKACSAFRERKQRQEVQKLRRWVSALTVALVVAVGSGLFAFRQATIANLRLDAARVEDLLESDPVEGLILAIKATGESQRKLRKVLPEVQASLYAAIGVPVETNVFKGNGQPVNAVAFSPDGKIIASGREDGTIELLDPDGNPVIPPLKGENGGVWSLAFSPDGKTIASGYEDGTIKLWDLQGRLIVPLKGHESYVYSVAFSPDGKIIASGSSDKKMRLWSISGKPIGEPLKHEDDVNSVAFSLDGKIIASGSFDKKLRLWNLQNQVVSPIGSPLSSPKEIHSIAFSPDHQMIATGHGDGSIQFWNLQSLKIEKTFPAHDKVVSSIAFDPDGSQLMSGSWDNTIRFWDRQGNSINKPLRGHRRKVRSVAYSPDGKTAISGSVDGTVRLWKPKDNSTFEKSQKSAVRSLAVSPDGATIISGSEDGKVYLWNVRQKKLMIPPLEAHKERVSSLAFSPDGTMFVSGSYDQTLQLLDTQGQPIPSAFREQTDYVTAVAFSPNSQMIASGTWDGKISLWNLRGQSVFSSIQAHQDVVSAIAFSPDGKTIASASWDGTIRLSDLNGNLVNSFSTQHGVYTLAFDSRSQILVTGHADGSVQLWNLEGEKPNPQNSFIAHQEAVTSVAFNEYSQLGKIIVSSSRDNTLRFWDLQGNQIGERIHPDDVLSSVITPDGQTIVTGSEDGSLGLWPGGDWITWLNIGCNKLRGHPNFLLDAESSTTARKTCQNYELEMR